MSETITRTIITTRTRSYKPYKPTKKQAGSIFTNEDRELIRLLHRSIYLFDKIEKKRKRATPAEKTLLNLYRKKAVELSRQFYTSKDRNKIFLKFSRNMLGAVKFLASGS